MERNQLFFLQTKLGHEDICVFLSLPLLLNCFGLNSTEQFLSVYPSPAAYLSISQLCQYNAYLAAPHLSELLLKVHKVN